MGDEEQVLRSQVADISRQLDPILETLKTVDHAMRGTLDGSNKGLLYRLDELCARLKIIEVQVGEIKSRNEQDQTWKTRLWVSSSVSVVAAVLLSILLKFLIQ